MGLIDPLLLRFYEIKGFVEWTVQVDFLTQSRGAIDPVYLYSLKNQKYF